MARDEDAPRMLLDDARRAHTAIAAGRLRGKALLDRILAAPISDRESWVDEALGLEEAPPDAENLPRGGVPYLPCGVHEIVAMVRDVPITARDTFVDLGAGLGRVVMLVHLLSGARAHGVEIQEPLVNAALRRCETLGLRDVSFERANVLEAELTGTVFFLYSPFNGATLTGVMDRLRVLAAASPIVVCAVDLEFDLPWLVRRASSSVSLAIYESRTLTPPTPSGGD